MDIHSPRPGTLRDSWLSRSVSLLRSCNSLGRKYFIIAAVCSIYLFFTVCFSHARRSKSPEWSGHGAVAYNGPEQTNGPAAVSTRSNVVYITLKSKRHRPAVIRGTVRPKPRRRKVKHEQHPDTDGPRKRAGYLDGGDDPAIRIYSQRAPPWFSGDDITSMRFLARAALTRVEQAQHPGDEHPLFRSASGCEGKHCGGVVKRPLDMSEVFAFHLDRVLGLNRTLPAVSRSFPATEDGRLCPVVLWDPDLIPVVDSVNPSERLTWGSYQTFLKHKCWHHGVVPRPEWSCSSIHHQEWSRLVVFDFLLQIYERLDRSCCGFKPRPEDACVTLHHHTECADEDGIELKNIVRRADAPHRLVFFNNKGFFDRDEDNLDFRLLRGIKEFPEGSVSVLKSGRLREKLLQSLFLDRLYWESQGGRQGIEKLIDVIEKRARILLTYMNAHGIKVVAMPS